MTWFITFVLITILFCGCTFHLKNKSLELEKFFYQKTQKEENKFPVPHLPPFNPPPEIPKKSPIIIPEEEKPQEKEEEARIGPQDEINLEENPTEQVNIGPGPQDEKEKEEDSLKPWWHIWD